MHARLSRVGYVSERVDAGLPKSHRWNYRHQFKKGIWNKTILPYFDVILRYNKVLLHVLFL